MQIRGVLILVILVGLVLFGIVGSIAFNAAYPTVDRQYTMEELNNGK